MSSLVVRLFGRFSVLCDGQGVDGFDGCKVQELFCYLLLHPDHPCTRDSLATLLWEELPATQSKKRLSQTLWQVQSALGALPDTPNGSLLKVAPEVIQLSSGPDLWLDVVEFQKAFARVQETSGQELDAERAEFLRGAVDLYQGDLLGGWGQDWCLFERERLQNMYLVMVDKAMAFAESHHQYERALTYGVRLLGVDRAHERTHRRLMRLYYLLGDRTAALRQYERCRAALDEELGVRPAKRTSALYEQIRADEIEHLPRLPAGRSGVADEPHVSLTDALARLEELRRMLGMFQVQVEREIDTVERAFHQRT